MSENLQKKVQQLNTLMEMSALVNSTLDSREIKKRAIEAATRLVDAETGSLLLVDQETGDLFFEVALGDKGDAVKEIRLSRGQGIAGSVLESGQPLIIQDVQSDPRFFKTADEKSFFKTKSMLSVPLMTKERAIGVLEAINKNEGLFDEEDKDGLCALANQVAVAVENADLYQQLKETFYETAQALAETIEKRDPYTGGHTQRVMRYSVSMGELMGLSGKELEDLKLAAILHDIGKIGVRDDVLLKQAELDDDEVRRMNRHPEYGAEILRHVSRLKDIVPGVRGHHEKYDGSGYPDQLKGDDIPLIARIIAVADTFDAMTTDRPYRKGLAPETAFEVLNKQAWKQFDGKAVELLIRAYAGKEA